MAVYVGIFRRLKTYVVKEVRMMTTYCLTDMKTCTARNIFRICDEFGFTIDITSQGVKEAYNPHTVLPDDEWKLDMLQQLLAERLELRKG